MGREPPCGVDATIAAIADRQYGVFTRAQATAAGISKGMISHRVATGRWEPVARNCFRVRGATRSWEQSLMSASLAWGRGAAASHRSAGRLFGFVRCSDPLVELIAPPGRRRSDAPGIVHHVELPRSDLTVVRQIPVTTPGRTLVDLASVLDNDVLEEVLDHALLNGTVRHAGLRARFEQLAVKGRPGVATLRALLAARDVRSALPESVLEQRLLTTMRRAGLPRPVLQHEIRRGGRLVARVDAAYPERKVAIEADGARWHADRTRWERDLRRSNEITLLGWALIHVTWSDLTRAPERVVETIARALARA